MNDTNHKTRLEDIYKRVLICKICNGRFGSDLHSAAENGVCPICQKRINVKGRNYSRI